jgi:hypothetical protein
MKGRIWFFVDKSNGLNDTIRIFLPVTVDSLSDTTVAAKSKEQHPVEQKSRYRYGSYRQRRKGCKKEDTLMMKIRGS